MNLDTRYFHFLPIFPKPCFDSETDRLLAHNIKLTKRFIDKNEDLLITHADKGNITVILKKQECLNKMNKMLDDDTTYEKIPYNPLFKLQKQLFKKLENWRIKGYLGNDVKRKDLITDNTNIARMYGLPKTHKENYPMRPVVSCINSPTYFLAKTSLSILTCLFVLILYRKRNNYNMAIR